MTGLPIGDIIMTSKCNYAMPSLTIRDLPDDVMLRLRRAAAEQHRSLNAQAIHWLAQASRQERSRAEWVELLAEAKRSRERIPRQPGDSADLIRRMRDSR